MKEASHGVFRVGVGINPRPGIADSGSSSRQMMNQDDAEAALPSWLSEKILRHIKYIIVLTNVLCSLVGLS